MTNHSLFNNLSNVPPWIRREPDLVIQGLQLFNNLNYPCAPPGMPSWITKVLMLQNITRYTRRSKGRLQHVRSYRKRGYCSTSMS